MTRYKGRDVAEKCARHKIYRNRLEHIQLRYADRQYYHERLCEYRYNVKKSWQVMKYIYIYL